MERHADGLLYRRFRASSGCALRNGRRACSALMEVSGSDSDASRDAVVTVTPLTRPPPPSMSGLSIHSAAAQSTLGRRYTISALSPDPISSQIKPPSPDLSSLPMQHS